VSSLGVGSAASRFISSYEYASGSFEEQEVPGIVVDRIYEKWLAARVEVESTAFVALTSLAKQKHVFPQEAFTPVDRFRPIVFNCRPSRIITIHTSMPFARHLD